jgi:hypothetical protein
MRKFVTYSNLYSSSTTVPVSETQDIAPAGTRCVLGAFAIDLTIGNGNDGSSSYTFTDLPRVEFQSMDDSFTTRFAVPAVQSAIVFGLWGGSHTGVLNKIPGPGILFDNGMRFKIDVPVAAYSGLFVTVNLVYSV